MRRISQYYSLEMEEEEYCPYNGWIRDYGHAKRSLEAGDYEWACFASHQAAEKTVKALYQAVGIEVWGHSVSRMLENFPENLKPPAEIIDMVKELDRHYIPSPILISNRIVINKRNYIALRNFDPKFLEALNPSSN